ncbi:MAG: hypothetical protein R6X08_08660, partial [Desulfosalsimonadaceae bacterium]
KADTQDFRELLFREFDLSKVTPKPPEDKKTAEPETAKPDTAKPKAEETTAPPETEKPKEPESATAATAELDEQDTAEKAGQPPADQGGGPPGPPPSPGGPGGPEEPPREPMLSNNLKLAILGLVVVFAFIIVASVLNSGKYYVRSTDSGVAIWKGDFAPRGEKKVVSIEDAEVPAELRNIQGPTTKKKAYSLPFDYFMQRAEKLAEKPGTPDYRAIRKQLQKARKYAVTSGQIQKVKDRLAHMESTEKSRKTNK